MQLPMESPELSVDANGKVITLTLMRICMPPISKPLANLTVTIGDQIAARHYRQHGDGCDECWRKAVNTLADDVVAPIAADQKGVCDL